MKKAILCLTLFYSLLFPLAGQAAESAGGPQSGVPVLSNYPLGTGDLIKIQVFDEPQLDVEARLTDAGTVSYPFLGELNLKGETTGAVEQMVIDGLKGEYLINPKVTVTVLEYRQFFVNGEVEKPGGYPFSPGLTIIKAISLAGGFTDYAAKDKIEISRNFAGKEESFIAGQDALVMPGDILTVKQSYF